MLVIGLGITNILTHNGDYTRYQSLNAETFLIIMLFGMRYQFCPVCRHSAMEDKIIMKACPCYEVFYCR